MQRAFRSVHPWNPAALVGLALALLVLPAEGALATPLIPKVLVLGWDGLRPDALAKASTPTFDALRAEGSFSDQVQTGPITVSAPGWMSTFTGVQADKHGITDNTFLGYDVANYPTFFARAKAADPSIATAMFANWIPLSIFFSANSDRTGTGGSDALVASEAAEHLATGDPDLIVLVFDDTDAAGHAFGFSPDVPEYIAAAEAIDAKIATVLAALRARPTYDQEDWLILSSSDHGGIGTNHGADTPVERTVFYLASGPSAHRNGFTSPPEVVDIAVAALTHLGVPIDPAWNLDGQPAGLATVPEPGLAPLLCVALALTSRRLRTLAKLKP